MNSGEPLPSFNEGFGCLTVDAIHPALSVQCPTCEGIGLFSSVLEGTACTRCHFINRDSSHLDYLQSAALIHQNNYSNGSSNPSPILQSNPILWNGLPDPSDTSSAPSSRLSTLANLQVQSHTYVQPNSYNNISPQPIIKFVKRIPLNQHREKDARHCDAEKTRRDYHRSYIDLSFSLAKKFHAADFLAQDALHDPKLSKRKKLQQLAIWQFQTYLPRDKKMMRAWLDEEKRNGEKLSRDTTRVSKNGDSRVKTEGRGHVARSLKDEAVLEVLHIMEDEFEKFYTGDGNDEME